MSEHPKNRPGLLTLALLMLINAGASTPVIADAVEITSALQSMPVTTDLPGGQNTAGGMSTRLRPELTYPTLRLDEREQRQPQAEAPAPAPVPETPNTENRTDFQRLVAQSLGMDLPIFGHDLFRENTKTFEPLDTGTVPSDFILGPGDEVYIRAWGSIDLDYRATIDRLGTITIPKVGEIPLAGVRFGDLREHIQAILTRSFRGFELSVSMGQLRSIRIYVTGFARTPGAYTVSSLTTLLNALFYAGGPDMAGDLRQIELRRSGQLVTTIDIYDFLLTGQHDNDLRLLPEDVIHIPAALGEVAIAGAVNRPGIYQLRGDESISDLIDWGGGLGVTATTHRVMLERINEDNQRIVVEYSSLSEASELSLNPGDLVLIQPLSPKFLNAVTLRGHVAQPLRHEWAEGMRVSDLLPTTNALVSPGYWASRNESSQILEFLGGSVETSVTQDFPDINWEYALLERIDRNSMQSVYIPFNLEKAIKDRDPEHDLVLLPEDKITVFSLADFKTPVAQRRRMIRIEGEVNNAGIYPVPHGATLAEVIEIAGGTTADSYLYGMELKRDSVRKQQEMRIHEAIDQLEQDYSRHLIDRSRNVLSGDMSMAIAPETNAIWSLINRLRQAQPSGRIILELEGDINSPDGLPLLSLDDGDTVYIPPQPATIEVVGAVFRQGSFLHSRKEKVSDYLESAGLQETADTRHIYLVRPDGSFNQAQRNARLWPGDTIFVPEKTDRESTVRLMKDWTQVVYQLGLGAAGLTLLGVF